MQFRVKPKGIKGFKDSRADLLSRDMASTTGTIPTVDETLDDDTFQDSVQEDTEEAAQAEIARVQHLLEEELRQHNSMLNHYKASVEIEIERHNRAQQELDELLRRALGTAATLQEDSNYWLENIVTPEPRAAVQRPTRREKALIKERVKQAYLASQRR